MAHSGVMRLGVPVLGLAFSLSAVHRAGLEAWGLFAYAALAGGLAEQLFAWGGQGHLLVLAGRKPGRLDALWRRRLLARLPLWGLGVVGVLLVPFCGAHPLAVILWLAGTGLHRSFEVYITWRKDFAFAFAVEAVATAGMLGVLWAAPAPDAALILRLFAGASVLKALACALRYRPRAGRPSADDPGMGALLREGWGYFLPGFLGMVHVRAGTYVVALYLDPAALGCFHLLTNLLFRSKEIAWFLLQPFLKAYYRAGDALVGGYLRQGLRQGVVCTPLYVGAAWLLLTRLYGLDLPLAYLPAMALYVFPFFIYLLQIHYLMARDRAGVARVEGLACVLHLAFCAGLVPTWGLHGALAAGVAGQWFLFLAYRRLAGMHRRGAGAGAVPAGGIQAASGLKQRGQTAS